MTIGPGVFVPVVGPSGAGKDSLIAHAAATLGADSAYRFAKRVVTRPADPGAEAHDTLDEAAFLAAERQGAFALSWRSHGLSYGIPIDVDRTIRAGGVVVAKVSRGVVEAIEARYGTVIPVLVTVSPEVLAARLAARGRETADQIAARIARNAEYDGFGARCRTVDNSGSLSDAGDAFGRSLRAAAERSPAAAD